MGKHYHWWHKLLMSARRAMGFLPTRKELESELDSIEAEPLTKTQIDDIMEYTTKTRIRRGFGRTGNDDPL